MEASAVRTIAGGRPGWMVVRIGDTQLALPIDAVGEVLPPPALAPVPMAPRWLVGVGSVRGEVIPVVDAGLRLGGSAAGADAHVVLVTADDSGEQVGLLVDGVAGLIELGAGETDAGPTRFPHVPPAFVAARVTAAGGVAVPVLALAAFLDPAVESSG